MRCEFDRDGVSRLASHITVEELEQRGVEAAALVLVDNAGVARTKCVPMTRLEPVAETGVGCSVVFAGAKADDAFTRVPELAGPTEDLRLVPDRSSAAVRAANPYLVLGGLIAAGLDGLERHLEIPAPVVHDPATLSQEVRVKYGITQSPETLSESTDALDSSVALREAIGALLHGSIVEVRRGEAAANDGLSDDELVTRYRGRF